MQKPSGLIIMLLVLAVLLSSPSNSPEHGHESPQTDCGDSLVLIENQEDSENGIAEIIAFIIITVLIIDYFIDSDN